MLSNLRGQVLIVQGARQVGKTSFILNAFQSFPDHPQIKLNLLYPHSFTLNGVEYFGRDFFGSSPQGEGFLKNIELELGPLDRLSTPALIFVDEVDRSPNALEAVQTLAEFSGSLKFVFTGSNFENIPIQNAATGRKCYFDLYPITFREFLRAAGKEKPLAYLQGLSILEKTFSEFHHHQLEELFDVYLRLGGMPKILDTYLDPSPTSQPIPQLIKDLALSIEENVKSVLGDKSRLYEYEEVLRKIVLHSTDTLKYTRLQVQHAGQREAKKLVAKTVGARVAHKIRLYESERDLSKYVLFDSGLAHYLLAGSDLLRTQILPDHRGILYETVVGQELIAGLVTRDDLHYWKSGNKAEVDYLLRSPALVGIDVKSDTGSSKSLNSFALLEETAACLVKIGKGPITVDRNHRAALPNFPGTRSIPFISIPHYLTSRLSEFVGEIINY